MSTLVRRAGPRDVDEVVTILTEAFAGRAHFGWMFGTGESSRRLVPVYFRWATQRALAVGEVYLVDGRATMMGLPSSALDTRPEQVQATNQQLRALGAERAERVLAVEAASRQHHPMHTPHWYGWFGGVRPAHRGHNLGRLLIRHILTQHSDLPYYHEVPDPRIAALWEREGFKTIGAFEITDGVTLTQQVHADPTSGWWAQATPDGTKRQAGETPPGSEACPSE